MVLVTRISSLFVLLLQLLSYNDAAAASSVVSTETATAAVAAATTTEDDETAAADDINPAAATLPGSAPACSAAAGEIGQYHKYHSERSCHRAAYNQYKHSVDRHLAHMRLLPTGFGRVPDQKTVPCPERGGSGAPADLRGEKTSTTMGFDTIWIVENTASRPVVLAWVNPDDGMEYSTANTKVSPAAADPATILPPGRWRALHTTEGHVFHVRDYVDDGVAGELLLQHRAGYVAVGGGARDPPLSCPAEDAEPVVQVSDDKNTTTTTKPDPAYQRGPPQKAGDRECNTIGLGFRNASPCPLHGYWLDPAACRESFKFHLGTDPAPADFMTQWQSPTKYEDSFVGQTFTFRLAADTSRVVDTYTIRPTVVTDCPDRKTQAAVQQVTVNDGILVPVGRFHNLPTMMDDNNSNNATFLVNNNNGTTTVSRRSTTTRQRRSSRGNVLSSPEFLSRLY